jgi:hypothetical protein
VLGDEAVVGGKETASTIVRVNNRIEIEIEIENRGSPVTMAIAEYSPPHLSGYQFFSHLSS